MVRYFIRLFYSGNDWCTELNAYSRPRHSMLSPAIISRTFSTLLLLFLFGYTDASVKIGLNGEFLVDNQPFFPIMQWMQNASRVHTQSQYGINLFCVPGNIISATVWCDSAAANSVYACCQFKPEDVSTVKDHPALFGWFFGDEPDLAGNEILPDSISKQYNVLKLVDPNHPAFLTITSRFYSEHALPAWMNGSDSLYYEYPKYTDVIGFDLYPVYGWCRPDWIYQVGDAVTELRTKYLMTPKPVYAWIECGKTSSRWCNIDARGENDGPYPYEVEAQVWLAIIHGAKAIGYFTHSWECPDYTQWCVSDEQIEMLTNVNHRITELTKVICASEAPQKLTISSTGIEGGNGRIDATTRTYGDSIYIIATHVINITGAAQTQLATITIPQIAGAVSVYGENREINVSAEGTFIDTFTTDKPVHIYSAKSIPNKSIRPVLKQRKKPLPELPKTNIHIDRPLKGQFLDLMGTKVNADKQKNPAAKHLVKTK